MGSGSRKVHTAGTGRRRQRPWLLCSFSNWLHSELVGVLVEGGPSHLRRCDRLEVERVVYRTQTRTAGGHGGGV